MALRTRVVALLLFGSGFCALIYQTTWLREFRLIFGASTAASAAVLGVFMCGLGFGGIILGRRSETKTRPLGFYAQLELLIAASAALSPLLIWGARHLYIGLGGTAALGMFGGTVVRLILAAVIIGIPTFLMGGTLPAAARAVVEGDDAERRAIGVLYGVNTLGAVTGVIAATFYCLEIFGNRITLWIAAALNIAVAMLALFISRTAGEARPVEPPRPQKKQQSTAIASPLFVLVAAAVVGFAFFLMEMVWYRMLAPLLGGSTFSFGLILATALVGIGLGGAAYSRFGLRRSASLQFFAVTCAAEAFFIALPYALGDRIAVAAMLLRPLGIVGFHGHVLAWSSLCSIVVLPTAFVAGLQFPLLIALLGKGSKSVGSHTGYAYGWNTAGALVGALAGGFGFMPLFSAPGVWRLVTIVLSVLAVLAVALAWRNTKRFSAALVCSIGIVILTLIFLRAEGPTAFWRHSEIGVGRLKLDEGSSNQLQDLINATRRRILWEKDGVESGVAVIKENGLAFIVNGRSDGNAKMDAGTQVMSGLLGGALHPQPRKVLVVGLGTGSTAGWLAAIPGMERVDVVELEPAVLKVAEQCVPVNQNALQNPKLNIIVGDAREVLLTTREKYDVIISEPSNPYRAGVAGLFTREYYQSVNRCLNPGGMFLQWVQAYDVDDRTIQIFYRTLHSVFSNIESWQTQDTDLLLLASHEPVRYDAVALRARLSEEPFKTALPHIWRATKLEDFLAHYIAGPNVAEAVRSFSSGPLNTDDRTVIEFAFARSVNLVGGFEIGNLRASAREAQADRPPLQGDIDWNQMEEARLSIYTPVRAKEKGRAGLTPEQQSRADAAARYLEGDIPGALRHWRAQSEQPKTLTQLSLVAEGLAFEGDEAAQPYIEELEAALPLEAKAIQAELFWRTRRPNEAVEVFESFLQGLRNDPWTDAGMIRRSLKRIESLAISDGSKVATLFLYHALRTPFSVYNNEAERLSTAKNVARYLDGNYPGEKSVTAIEAFEPHVPWQRTFLEERETCYKAAQKPRAAQASRDLDRFLRNEGAAMDISNLAKSIEKGATN